MAVWPSGPGTRLQSASRGFDSRLCLVYQCKRAACPACGADVAVRFLTGFLFRHGAGTACPGSDQLPADGPVAQRREQPPPKR
jgi:hypothetical protein